MTTKIERINSAYKELRISGLTVNPTPEHNETAIYRLENMMSELEFGRNICMNYNFEDVPDLNSLTNVKQPFWNMIDTNLARRLAPLFGKQPPQILLEDASQSLATASAISAASNVRQVSPPNRMPIGDGTSLRYNKWQRFNRQQQVPPATCETNTMFIDDVNNFRESFRAYLDEAETIDSFVITVDDGLTLVASANSDPFIDYTIKADDNTVTSGTWQQVKIVITTSTGRVNTRFINFEVNTNLTVNNN